MPVYEEHGDITLLAGESQQFNIGKVPKPFKVLTEAHLFPRMYLY